jgi:hypothetical protein
LRAYYPLEELPYGETTSIGEIEPVTAVVFLMSLAVMLEEVRTLATAAGHGGPHPGKDGDRARGLGYRAERWRAARVWI